MEDPATTTEQRSWARFGYSLLFGLCRILPYRLGYLLAWIGGWIGWWCDARGRAQVRRNLEPLLPPGRPLALRRAVRRNYISFVVTVLDHCRMVWIAPRWLTAPNLRIIDPWGLRDNPPADAAALVAAHCNWELYARFFQLHGLMPKLAAIALSHDDPGVDALFSDLRARLGLTSVYLDRAPLASLRWLKDGGQVALVSDRVYGSNGMAVRLGRSRLELPVGPAALSVQTGAPIIPFHFVRHTPTAFTVIIGPRIHPDPSLPRDRQVRHLVDAVAGWFDRFLRCTPAQWCAFQPIWLHDPRHPRCRTERPAPAPETAA